MDFFFFFFFFFFSTPEKNLETAIDVELVKSVTIEILRAMSLLIVALKKLEI